VIREKRLAAPQNGHGLLERWSSRRRWQRTWPVHEAARGAGEEQEGTVELVFVAARGPSGFVVSSSVRSRSSPNISPSVISVRNHPGARQLTAHPLTGPLRGELLA